MQKKVKIVRHAFAGSSPIAYSSRRFQIIMGLFYRRQISRAVLLLLCLGLLFSFCGVTASAANIGTVVPVVGPLRLDPATAVVSPVPTSPPATPPIGIPAIPASPTPAGFLAGLVTTASGNLVIGLSTNRLFVYEVASGTVLRSRNVTGLRAIL